MKSKASNALTELRQVIDKLVPLLAGKGLRVTQRGSQAFVRADPETNKPIVVNIPNVSENASGDFIRAINGFIDHEVAHVLITNWAYYGGPGGMKEVLKTMKREDFQKLINLHNITEDTMIEKEIVKIFPGSRRNLRDLREHFIEKVTKPAVKQAINPDEVFAYILVPALRAMAGHQEFQDFMDEEGHWEQPKLKGLIDAMKPASIELLKTAETTEETYEIAADIYEILYPKAEDAPKEEESEPEENDDPSDGESDSSGEKGDDSDDDSEEKSGESDGDGSKSDKEDEKDEDESGDEGEPSEDDGEDEGGSESGCDEGEDKDECDGDDDESSDKDYDGPGGDEVDYDSDESDVDGSEDASESDGDEESAGESDPGDDDGESGTEDDGGPDDTSGESPGDDNGDSDEDASDEGQSGESGGEPESGNDDGVNLDSDGAPPPPNIKTDGDVDDGELADEITHDSGKNDSAGGGVGGSGGTDKTMFDYKDDIMEGKDLGAEIMVLISKEAEGAIDAADWSTFSTEWDRIEPLEVPNINAKWIPQLDEDVMKMTGPMQKDIERIMASQSHSVSTPGHKRGKLHGPSLWRVGQNDPRVFTQKQVHKSKDTAVTLLVDNSGSMRGDKMDTAMVSSYALSVTLDRVKIVHEMIGFTTGGWGGLDKGQKDALQEEFDRTKGRIEYDRVEPLVMPIYKSFEERLNSTVRGRIAYARNAQQGLWGNIDGESLMIAAQRLARRPESRKVILVLSDGQPAGGHRSGSHLKGVAKHLSESGFEIVGIGIKTKAVEKYYDNHVVLNNLENLPGQVMQEIKSILI